MKKSRSDAAVRSALSSYLQRRNYPNLDGMSNTSNLSQTAEQMAISSIVHGEASRPNSILFSSIKNDPVQMEKQYSRFVSFIKELESESIKSELRILLCPFLCHLYIEMLRGGHGSLAKMFLRRQSATVPRKDLSYHHLVDGNLPSALYRPNSLEQLFNNLQNGTIDDSPEKDHVNQVLDDLSNVHTLQDIETRPLLAAFRSCKFELLLTPDALNVLKNYLAKDGHVLLMQVLQTWFHIEVGTDRDLKSKSDDKEQQENAFLESLLNDNPDAFSKCNGQEKEEAASCSQELQELEECIRAVRESAPPLKLYEISAPGAHLICGRMNTSCSMLCGGFNNSEIRIWDIGRNYVQKKNVNSNISHINVASNGPTVTNEISHKYGVVLRGHSGPVQACSFLEKEGILLSCSHDNTMRAWKLRDYSCAAIYGGHNYPIWCMDVWNGGVYIATGSHDRTARLWSLDRTYPLRLFVGHTLDVNCVEFHPNGAYVATGSADKSVRMWSVAEGDMVRIMTGHGGPVHAISFSPNGKYLASAGEDKKIKIWDLTSGNSIQEYSAHQATITSLHWSPIAPNSISATLFENAALYSAGMDATVNMWDVQPDKPVSGQEATSNYSTTCAYLVKVHKHENWISAIGTKKRDEG